MTRLRFAALAGVVIAAVVLTAAAAGARSKAQTLSLDVTPDVSTFAAVRTPAQGEPFPTGPFYIQGHVYSNGTLGADGTAPAGAKSIGTFRCWGWIFNGKTFGAAVNQRYELAQGTISTQGVEGTAVRNVTGASGLYSGSHGAARVQVINPKNFSFRITIPLG